MKRLLVPLALTLACSSDAPTTNDAAPVDVDAGVDVAADLSDTLEEEVSPDVDEDLATDAVEDVATDADVEDTSDAREPDTPAPDVTEDAIADAGEDADDAGETPREFGNVLIIISDDLGVDDAVCYADDAAPSPHLQALCDRGVVFDNVWSQPICSPTRAATLTGRFGFRTNVGDVAGQGSPGIGPDEWTIPRALDEVFPGEIAQANIGKWHLATSGRDPDGDGPIDMGWDYFTGLIVGAVSDYFSWTKRIGEEEAEQVDRYITTELVDDAIAWIDEREEPWLLWLALTSPHDPVHLPPAHLHTSDLDGSDIEGREREYYHAMIEAMDTEIGRLLASMDPEELEATTIIYFGDNGPSSTVSTRSRGRSKGSLFQGGIHVPMIIAGPAVEGRPRRYDGVVSVADVFATTLDTFGVPREAWPTDRTIDSRSLLPVLQSEDAEPVRDWVYSDYFGPNVAEVSVGRTVRNERFKLIRFEMDGDRFYDVVDDPRERRNLLESALSVEAQAAFDELDALLGTLTE